jgi:pyruvate-ferredoxin/flavodoxin oxidoreductase
MTTAMQNQKAAVNSAQWLLYRYNPDRAAFGENPLQLDSAAPRIKVTDYFKLENRFKMLDKIDPEAAKELLGRAQEDVSVRRGLYEYLAARKFNPPTSTR